MIEGLALPAVMAEYVEGAIRGYVEALLWTTSCGGMAPVGVCDHLDLGSDCDASLLDLNYSLDDMSAGALVSIHGDVADFVRANRADLEGMESEQAGHDFLLTRCGHGAGFWDRGLGERGERLSDAARVYGGTDAYIGDNGKVEVQ